MSKKVLIVATVVKTHINVFHIPALKYFKEQGYETYVAARNDYEKKEDCIIPFCDNYIDIPFERFPFKPKNIKAYKQLKGLINSQKFDIIHCHTPVGSVLARLAAKKTRKNGTRVLYTAHGFHFYDGAPKLNWIIYYPLEKLMSYFTDTLICINREDFERAKIKMHAKETRFVHGVGIDTTKFSASLTETQKLSIREGLGISNDDTVLLSVGELIPRKNHKTVIQALAKLNVKNIKYIICGRGPLMQELKAFADELGVSDMVMLLGFRKDISELCNMCDIFVFPSLQEGLPVALMEAMACGKPCIASRIRGNTDLITDGKNGILCKADSSDEFSDAILRLISDKEFCKSMSLENADIINSYDLKTVMDELDEIYNKISE